jgi:diaminohydroxyphosphoribosylaminopyrimidine deaminase/5-amino-6-(5-phosphoribosylamino)uracil reductase
MSGLTDLEQHQDFMSRALQLAKRATGRTSPNPLVGCIITRGSNIVAEGFHRRPGAPHAEIEALDNLDVDPKSCRLYVNLEPCCHEGRTSPCTKAIIEAGIQEVYIGLRDPNPKVDGKGVEALREAGVTVKGPILPNKSLKLNQPYLKAVSTDYPWVTAKFAMSLDGRIATRTGDSRWISNDESRRQVHEWRNQYDAILVGEGTFFNDDPRLTARIDGGRNPVRVAIDAALEGDLDSNLYGSSQTAQTITIAGESAPESKKEKLRERGVDIITGRTAENGWVEPDSFLPALVERGLNRVLVEGGGTLIGSLFDGRFIDDIEAFISPKIIGGADAPSPIEGEGIGTMDQVCELSHVKRTFYGSDILVSGNIPDQYRAHCEPDFEVLTLPQTSES